MTESQVFSSPSPEGESNIEKTFAELSLIDDLFFRAVMRDNKAAAQAIVRVALDMPDVEIESVSVQHDITFPKRRGVQLDLKAKKPDGTLFDIEVQKVDEGNLPKRARYYLSALTIDSLQRGEDYDHIPDTYILFVCKRDPFQKGQATYHFIYRETKTGENLGDGGHIVFFNCSYTGKDAYGTLARDLTTPDYAGIADPVLKDTVKSGKIGERRNEIVSGVLKRFAEECKAEGEQANMEKCIIAFLKDGRNSPEVIAEILSVPLEYVLELKEREGI